MAHLEIIRTGRPSRWQRFSQSLRSFTIGPFSLKDPALVKHFGGRSAGSGVVVTEATAMNYAAVWAAVNLISSHIASVPLVLYKTGANGAKDRFIGHPLYRLVHDRPNPEMGSMVFRRTLQAHKLVWGNGYAEIERDGADRPKHLWPLLPYLMHPYYEGGRLRYRYANPSGDIFFDASDVLHIRGLGDSGVEGMGVIAHARESLGLGMAAERFGGAFFGNGSTFDHVITYPPGITLTPQAKDDNRKALNAQHQGPDKAYRRLALYEGAKIEQLGVPPNEAQFLETRQFQIEEVCRWFNIPPHKLKHLQRTSYNSIEHQSIEYVTDALDPDWVIWEQELNLKLVSPLEVSQQKIEHVREGMLRGDSASRAEFYSKLFSIGAITVNEVRARENLNPVAGGDTVFVPLNAWPLDRLEEKVDADLKAKEPPPPPPPPDDKHKDEEVKAARARAQAAEDARDIAIENARRADEARELIATAKAQNEERHAQEIAQLGDALAEANTSIHDAASRELALREDFDRVSAKAVAAAGEILAATAKLDEVVSERQTALASLLSEQAESASLKQATVAALAERDAAMALAEEAAKERDEAQSLVARAEAKATANELARVEAVEASQRAAADIAALQVSLDHAKRDIGIVQQEAAGAALALDTERQQRMAQRAAVLAAMRSLFVDASERLLQKESDRARKHQATGEKLLAWVETFYPMHIDTVRQAFRPLVGAWTAVTGGAPGGLLDRLVSEHVGASRQALFAVLDAEDDDQRAAMLERTLRRWEEERAETMADALVREGMAG